LKKHSLMSSPSQMKSEREPLAVVVLGPTASGKTALATEIARHFDGEIVNCDSVAMYREFEIGTAKPSAAERAEIPHHLVDCVDPLADISAGEYARKARQALREIEGRQRLPIISGGTGLYLRALVDGLFAGPQRSEELRGRLHKLAEKHGPEYLHRILRRLDGPAAERIHANDLPKVIRAVEVCLQSRPASLRQTPSRETSPRPTSLRPTMTQLWQEGRDGLRGFRVLRLGLNPEREALYARINQRAAKMFADGLIEETKTLLAKYGEQARPLTSLGYRQAMQYWRGELDRDGALATAQQAHRNYAKRQMTWFRREPEVIWLTGFGDDDGIRAEAVAAVRSSLG
jgi:tRNA dimethylallyltransferase